MNVVYIFQIPCLQIKVLKNDIIIDQLIYSSSFLPLVDLISVPLQCLSRSNKE